MMDAQTRIKMTLGDLLIQLSAAHARIEELEDELGKLRQSEMEKSNGKGLERDRPAL
jgi:hypothetical protein